MTDLVFARSQMAMSLAFHITFAAVGIGMPLLMAIAEGLHLRSRAPIYLDLARRWARGTAILFAVGAVSGTVLSFELGLLWPRFMEYAGGIIGMPFSLEGFAFFAEAIFLGIYLYGWDRISPVVHWLAGIAVAVSGLLSGIFVVTVNAWMNAPTGFELVDGRVTKIDPMAAMLNPGDMIARMVAERQPAKFAAMEAHYRTGAGAPITIGGIPNDATMTTRYALRIPSGLSVLAQGDAQASVRGLDSIPRDEWPNTRIVHWAFDLMVGAGFAMLILAAWAGWLWWRRRRLPDDRWLLRALVVAGPLGLIAIEAGWIVTEVGRQPWIIYGVMRTADAVTPMPGLVVPFVTFTAIYFFLSVILVYLLRRQFLETHPTSTRSNSRMRMGASRGG